MQKKRKKIKKNAIFLKILGKIMKTQRREQ